MVSVLLLLIVIYEISEGFTIYSIHHSKFTSITWIFPVYWVSIHLVKFIAKIVGRKIDANKDGLISVEIMMEIVVSCQYYVFYRNLFLEITSWSNFAIIKLLHVLLELVTYIGSMNPKYYQWINRTEMYFMNRIPCLSCIKTLTFPERKDLLRNELAKHESEDSEQKQMTEITENSQLLINLDLVTIWRVRLSIDYIIRLIMSVTSGIMYIISLLLVEYGYNKQFYTPISGEDVVRSIEFTIASIVIELIVYVIVIAVVWFLYGVAMIQIWNKLVNHRPDYFYTALFILIHSVTDIFVGKLDLTK